MILEELNKKIETSICSLYNEKIPSKFFQFSNTKADFKGDYTIIIFPFLSFSKKNLELTAIDISESIKKLDEISSVNIVGGFLNFNLSDEFFSKLLELSFETKNFGMKSVTKSSETTLIEFSSPNTNKPLHLGHIRNNLLGNAIANIFNASGHNVKKVQVINDRGIHVCKSMLAWLKYGNGKTPSSENIKGDLFVGSFYVLFEKILKEEKNKINDKNIVPNILKEAQELLVKWEKRDPEVIDLWKKMNEWVYEGMDETYKKLGITFDKNYYESDTYLDGVNCK